MAFLLVEVDGVGGEAEDEGADYADEVVEEVDHVMVTVPSFSRRRSRSRVRRRSAGRL